jgi:hypothetical protein
MKKRLIRRKKPVPAQKIAPTPGLIPTPGSIFLDIENAMVYGRPPPDHPVYALIGQITMRWSSVEERLDNCITALADTDHAITACITAQMMGHVPRCLTIKALAHWWGLLEIEKAMDGLQNALFEASELRNRAIHDLILIEEKTKAIIKNHRMSKKELHYGLKKFDDAELQRTIDLIEKRRIDCITLYERICEEAYEYYT